MNDKYSTTEGKTSEKLSDEAMLSAQWKNIDWHKAEREVNRLQIRIVKATQQKDYNAVKRLQYLLTHSFYAKALAVKRVVTNDGRRTPGVDGVLWHTPAKKMAAALSLTDKRYRARPLRRVYIEKKDKKNGDDAGMSSDRMGMKHFVRFGLYEIKGSINVQLAEKTGFSEEDAQVVKECLRTLFVNDASSARPDGSMEVYKLFWWEHNCKDGQYSSAKVHRSVKAALKSGVDIPSSVEDYDISVEPLEGLEPEILEGL